MADMIRSLDWRATPLGATEAWPQGLKAIVDLMLETAHPACIGWGPDLVLLYNDACIPLLGARHPEALGKPCQQAWRHPWVADGAISDGEAALKQSEARLAQELEATALLQDIGNRLISKPGVDGHFTELCKVARALMRSDCASIQVYDQGVAALQLVGQVGFHPDSAAFWTWVSAGTGSACGRALARGERVVLHDVETFEAETAEHEAWRRSGIRSVQSTPLVASTGQVVGMMSTHWHRQDGCADAHYRFFDLLARLAADFIVRLQAEAAVRESEQRQTFLLAFSDEVRELTDPVDVATTACRMLLAELDVDRAHWSEVDWATGDFVTTGSVHAPGVAPIEGRFPLAAWEPYSASHREGRAVVVDDTQTDPRASQAMRAATARMDIGAELAAPVLAEGRLASVLAVKQRHPRRWTSGEIALIEGVARRCWAELERVRAELALRETDTKFRTVFETMSEACCMFDMLYDAAGKPVDWRIVEANAGYERQSGLKDVAGRLASEIMPGTEPYWIETFDRVVRTGKPEQIEKWHAPTGRWIHSSTARVGGVGSKRLVSVFYDVTARKRAEQTLRASEERQRFLLQLSDAFRAQPDEAAIGRTCVTALARHMGVDRCYIAEMSDALNRAIVGPEFHRPDLPPAAGEHAYERYPDIVARFRSGLPLVSAHVAEDPDLSDLDKTSLGEGLGLEAVLCAFLHRGKGETIWSITVGTCEPRDWSDDDLRLVEEVTERAWAAIGLARADVGLKDREADLARVQRIGRVGGLDIDVAHGLTSRRSPEYLRLHGLAEDRRDETHGDWRSRVHPDDRDEAEQTLLASLDGPDSSYESEYRIIRPSDGEVRWIHARADVERDAQGHALRLVGAHIDVTEQKAMQAAVRSSEERLRALFESMDEAFYLVEIVRGPGGQAVELRYLQENAAAVRQLGSAVTDRTLAAFDAEFNRAWLAILGRVGRTGRSERFVRFSATTGRWHDFHIFAVSSGRDHVGVLSRDISESKRAEGALRGTELRIRTLIEGIPQLVWRASEAGLWSWASLQWTAFTGQPEIESHGWGWLDALHPDDRAIAREAWARAEEAGGFEVEYRIREATTDAFRWFQTRATPVRDDAGSIIEWLGTSTDIHELRELQGRQRVLVGELQHRTRNLLGVIRSMADRIACASDDLPDFRLRFQDRLEALGRVQGLLSRLGESDRLAFDELIDAELAAMEGIADKVVLTGPRGVRLRSGTVQMLAMALHELATNAVKYGALGQPQARLEIRWQLLPVDAGGRPWLHVDWLERGVHMPEPAPTAPRRGQGRELIEEAMAYQIGARTSFDITPDGVHCTIELPVSGRAPQ